MEDIYNLKFSQISKLIGAGLKKERLDQNITQQDMSDQINVSLSSIKKIEKGEIATFDSLMRILKRLGKLDVLNPLIIDDTPTLFGPNDTIQAAQLSKRQRASKKR